MTRAVFLGEIELGRELLYLTGASRGSLVSALASLIEDIHSGVDIGETQAG